MASLTAFAAFIFDLLTSSGLSCVLNALCCLGNPPVGAIEAGTGPLTVDMMIGDMDDGILLNEAYRMKRQKRKMENKNKVADHVYTVR